MLDVEVALARAQAAIGLIPAEAAAAIARACQPDGLDLDALAEEAANAVTPVIPLLRRLTDGADEAVAAHLHLRRYLMYTRFGRRGRAIRHRGTFS